MSLPIKINGVQMRVPTNWDELNLGQAIDLLQWSEDETLKHDLVQMASILSGVTRSALLDQRQDVIEMLVSPMMHNLNTTALDSSKWKSSIQYVLNGNVHNSFVKVGEVQYGCMDIFEKTLAMECKFIEKIPLLIAAFSYKGKFGGREIEARKDIEDLANGGVMKMKLGEAYALATFFLNRYQSFLSLQEKNLQSTPMPKAGRVLRNWKSLVSLVRSIRSQEVTSLK